MFETIVWATDGSESADSTLRLVTELAHVHGSKIVAVHATEVFHGGRSTGQPVLADEDEIRAKIATQVEDLRHAGFAAELKVESGAHGTVALIAEAAAEVDADLIVLGMHTHGALTGLLGGVTRGLLHATPCPVLAVPPLAVMAEKAEHHEALAV